MAGFNRIYAYGSIWPCLSSSLFPNLDLNLLPVSTRWWPTLAVFLSNLNLFIEGCSLLSNCFSLVSYVSSALSSISDLNFSSDDFFNTKLDNLFYKDCKLVLDVVFSSDSSFIYLSLELSILFAMLTDESMTYLMINIRFYMS